MARARSGARIDLTDKRQFLLLTSTTSKTLQAGALLAALSLELSVHLTSPSVSTPSRRERTGPQEPQPSVFRISSQQCSHRLGIWALGIWGACDQLYPQIRHLTEVSYLVQGLAASPPRRRTALWELRTARGQHQQQVLRGSPERTALQRTADMGSRIGTAEVGEAVLENARLMLHTDNIQACAEDFKDRYENEQPFRKAVEDEINSLYKVIDDANLTKMDLESQIESMKEELTLLSKSHEEDVKVLYKQLAGSQLEELDVPVGSGLDDILEKIRIHWERDIEKNRAETGALLRTKQQAETTAAVRTKEEELVEGLRTEFHETACKIQSLQAETESLRTLKRGLENSLYDAKHWHDIELQNLGSVISKLEAEMGEIKAETEQ
ncbi:PREDICTED: phakinin, partial [Buceros rhinoceros silvestris]|uniref:phakinin n=1 Tax=Buceros rhinoceros silvestris TaxID=175836 RepID=UPI0005295B13